MQTFRDLGQFSATVDELVTQIKAKGK
jgi:hypothetical protein